MVKTFVPSKRQSIKANWYFASEYLNCKLRFDIEPNLKIEVSASQDELDEFKKAKEEMSRLGFSSFQEYNEYLEFKRMRGQ